MSVVPLGESSVMPSHLDNSLSDSSVKLFQAKQQVAPVDIPNEGISQTSALEGAERDREPTLASSDTFSTAAPVDKAMEDNLVNFDKQWEAETNEVSSESKDIKEEFQPARNSYQQWKARVNRSISTNIDSAEQVMRDPVAQFQVWSDQHGVPLVVLGSILFTLASFMVLRFFIMRPLFTFSVGLTLALGLIWDFPSLIGVISSSYYRVMVWMHQFSTFSLQWMSARLQYYASDIRFQPWFARMENMMGWSAGSFQVRLQGWANWMQSYASNMRVPVPIKRDEISLEQPYDIMPPALAWIASTLFFFSPDTPKLFNIESWLARFLIIGFFTAYVHLRHISYRNARIAARKME